MRKPFAFATAIAVLGALLYALSPMLVWATFALVVLIWWAARTLPAHERRWFVAASIVALGLRYAAIGLLPLIAYFGGPFPPAAIGRGHSFVAWFGDGYYNIQRSMWLRNVVLGVPIAPLDYFEAFQPIFGTTSYQYVLAFVHVIFGPSPYGAHLLSVVLYALGVVLLYRIVRRSYGAVPAALTAMVLWFWPTLFAWSVSTMKEPEMFALSTVALAGTIVLLRGTAWPIRLGAVAALAVAAIGLDRVREGALPIVFGGLALGLAVRVATRRVWALATAIVVMAAAAWVAARTPRLISRAEQQVTIAAKHHIGHVLTPGQSYRALDERFYYYDDPREVTDLSPNTLATMTRPEMRRFLVRSVIAFFLVPELWHRMSPSLRPFIPVQVVWYAAVIALVPGLIVAWRLDPLVTCLVAGIIAVGVAAIAPNSGNIATLIRHRDIVSPFLFVIAAVGAAAVFQHRARRSAA